MALPACRDHPAPLATGAIQPAPTSCAGCGQSRGDIYVSPVDGPADYDGCLCPWCLSDGSAHARLRAESSDAAGVGGYGVWLSVPEAVVSEVTRRTPGFSGWQQEQWFTHCGAAAALCRHVPCTPSPWPCRVASEGRFPVGSGRATSRDAWIFTPALPSRRRSPACSRAGGAHACPMALRDPLRPPCLRRALLEFCLPALPAVL